jgi:hypothetical protein
MMCTILGLKIAHGKVGPGELPTKALQLLIDKAFAAVGREIQCELVSIGPTGAILLAQKNQHNARQALKLAEAVAAQSNLTGFADVKWPVAGVITQGRIRDVDVFGKSWNFEGRAAIAASRILSKLDPGLLAIETDVACPTSDESAIGNSTVVFDGKHPGEQYAVRIHPSVKFNRNYEAPSPPRQAPERVQAQLPAKGGAPKRQKAITNPVCQRLWIEAVSEPGWPPRVHERHELLIPPAAGILKIPIALCAPFAKATSADIRTDGPVLVFDETGPLAAEIVLPSKADDRIRIILNLPKGAKILHRAVNIVYRPVPIRGRIFIRMPASGYQVKHAIVSLWGQRTQLEIATSALTIRTKDNGGRHPIVAACFNMATNPYALAWDIERFEGGLDHEISWADTWQATSLP